ncbi:hypothetical protein PCANC_20001 [Puccinia coronata f. sp. avenae]|uniref:Uncharacterized protein n=1 Tax=Puccinia coronata f. sp. avenae TaxID=200324 RepID=A0A2N5UBG8_9BASI|nr:hypothetical protein PCANC_20001 [Puccinia coronata f. sp. avenae]PLW35042.1 hypothetical protein PCASD_16185 [Puccinia coronata f. sp. avenae]
MTPHSPQSPSTDDEQPNQVANQPHHPYNPSAYQPYCPIVVAPNFLPYGTPYPYPNIPYPPPSSPQNRTIQNQTQPAQNQNPNCGYDSYKPRYDNRQPNVTAKIVEVGSIEDEMTELQMAGEATADAIGPCPEIISDTGVKLKSVSEDLLLSAEWDDVRMTLPFLY